MIDIHSKADYPASALSNFCRYPFVIDGVECASMEGFLQSLKFKSPKRQARVCHLSGKAAKKKGRWGIMWRLFGRLYWRGKGIDRCGEDFTRLVRRAYLAMYQSSPELRKALSDTHGAPLCHSIGGSDKRKTVLTEEEFISFLDELRNIDP